jgi:hypothetical protein
MHFSIQRRGHSRSVFTSAVFGLLATVSTPALSDETVRLLSDGSDRLLITTSGQHRFTPDHVLGVGRVRYRSTVSTAVLDGGLGRYTLYSASASPEYFVTGRKVKLSSLEYPLPTAIEQKRPAGEEHTSYLLEALLLEQSNADNADMDCPDQCDTNNHPAPDDFESGPSIDEALTIDVRPESCQSYFREYIGIERGSRIEEALAHAHHYAGAVATVRSFPIVDFISDGEARVVRSRDLASQTYTASGALYERLMRDGRDIESGLIMPLREDGAIERTELGATTRLEAASAVTIVLEVVVQHGMTTSIQLDELRRAASDLASTWGIVLRIIEIP